MKLHNIKLTPAQQTEIYDWVVKVKGKGYLWASIMSTRGGLVSATFADFVVTVRVGETNTLRLACFNKRQTYADLKQYVENNLARERLPLPKSVPTWL